MSEDELAEFKKQMGYLRGAFDTPFWEIIRPHVWALADAVEGFNDRLSAIENKLK